MDFLLIFAWVTANGSIPFKVFASFKPPTGRELRHVMCVLEKAGFKPRTLGTGAECATNWASAPV